MGPWPLATALDSIQVALWSAAPFAALGLVMPADDGCVRVDVRNRLVTSASLLKPDELPEMLRPPIDSPIQLADLASHLQPGRPIDRILAVWNYRALLAVPIAAEHSLLWAALDEPRAFQSSEVHELERGADRLVILARDGEPPDAIELRLDRLDALSEVLPALGTALDIREVFAQLSAVAQRVLPHDAALVGILRPDQRKVRLHALSTPAAWTLPEVVDNPYPDALNQGFDFAVHRDLTANPIETGGIGAKLGQRSALRIAIRLQGRVYGVLALSSFQPNQYSEVDVPVARRIADYVMLALSHHQLADEGKRVEALRERAANLDMLDGLLKTLSDVLDLRDVFDRVSEIAAKVLPHDALAVTELTESRDRVRMYASKGLGDLPVPFETPVPDPRLLIEPWDFVLMDDIAVVPQYSMSPGIKAGMHSALLMPVRLEGRLHGGLNFYSLTPGHFTRDDVLVGRRIADHVALALSHQRLAEEARRNEELRSRAANLELLDHLLATLTDTGELGEMFDRISAIAGRVLAHDTMVVPLRLPDDRHAKVYARGGAEADLFPDVVEIPDTILAREDWEYDLVNDLQAHPVRKDMAAARRGYRSALRVPIRLEHRFEGALVFFSFTANVYKHADVLVARRIADRVTLLLANGRGLEASRRADEAVARASVLETRVRALTEELDARTGYQRVIGKSAAWRQVLTQAAQVASTDTTVLLLGESGTGKEVAARFLHRASARRDGPFIALNCAALPEQLLEAELFGYERGAFTGATQSKPGQLEQAGGGTLFLDEIGEMSPPAQAKILRVLQEREFQRLGGTRVLRTDARVVAATNRDLQKAMTQGTFREDLFYRLNVFAIHLPPLRDRRDDILPMSDAFLAEYGRNLGRPPAGISRDARDLLMAHPWPGNVRELRNTLERAAILCEGGLITAEHLSLKVATAGSAAAPSGKTATRPEPPPPAAFAAPPASAADLKSMERFLIEQALRNARFNKSKAAKELGMTRAQLYVRMRRYGLE
jgi:transcriptional regulator with GAF, ATPase, and Fis domain